MKQINLTPPPQLPPHSARPTPQPQLPLYFLPNPSSIINIITATPQPHLPLYFLPNPSSIINIITGESCFDVIFGQGTGWYCVQTQRSLMHAVGQRPADLRRVEAALTVTGADIHVQGFDRSPASALGVAIQRGDRPLLD